MIAADVSAREHQTLPPLKKLGKLADLRPVVVGDTREKQPLAFTRLSSVVGTLPIADYSFLRGEELFGVSRKSLADLVQSCVGENRARTERHLHRLRGMRFKRLVVVGPRAMIEAHRYRSAIRPAAVLHTLAAWEVRYDVPVVWADTPQAAARLVEGWVWWFARQMVEDANTLLRGTGAATNTP